MKQRYLVSLLFMIINNSFSVTFCPSPPSRHPPKCMKSHLWQPAISKFSVGACSRTPLVGLTPRASLYAACYVLLHACENFYLETWPDIGIQTSKRCGSNWDCTMVASLCCKYIIVRNITSTFLYNKTKLYCLLFWVAMTRQRPGSMGYLWRKVTEKSTNGQARQI